VWFQGQHQSVHVGANEEKVEAPERESPASGGVRVWLEEGATEAATTSPQRRLLHTVELCIFVIIKNKRIDKA